MKLVESNPALLSSPGLPQVVAQIRAALSGDIPDVAETVPEPPVADPGTDTQDDGGDTPSGQQGPPDGGLPQTAGNPAPTPGAPSAVAASARWRGIETL